MAMSRQGKPCACGCGRRVQKTTYNRKYATVRCKDRMSQQALRERRALLELARLQVQLEEAQ